MAKEKVKYIRHTVRGKGTSKEEVVKLKKPIKMYYSRHLKKWVSVPENK